MTPSSATEPKHTNHLIHETSPYLLQHAHNPVNWYPWGEEALNKARREDKPILLSIGYAACHWCHVMERESFENEEIAALMNEHFVNVKVDREERPDLDALYMLAVQMLAGQGGWPMTVFLTPALHPFYGGTYFPPTDLYGRPGFPRVLRAMAEYYHREKEDLVERTSKIEEMIRQVSRAGTAGELPDEATMTQAFHQLEARYDRVHGGFGSAPKFPQPSMIEFLLRFADRTGERDARTMSLSTLRQMAEGGLYDHLGGGFHRYSTDERWLVPHFEKMLYDNALLPPLYLAAYTMTGEERFAATARGTLEYVLRDMRSDEGGFYSSEDADSEGVEGKFYVWSRDEIESILGAEDAQLFCAYYGVTAQGNWEGANILHVAEEVASAAERLSVSEEALRAALSEGRRALFEARERRTRPAQDDKILTGWNGLMIAALAQGGATLDEPRYLDAAERAARFILDRLSRDGRLLRAYRGGHAKIEGFLEDYAYFVRGLLDLFEASQEARWLREADRLAEQMIALFWDDDAGGFFTTSAHHERLLTRLKDSHDGATPSGNSLAVGVLQRLAILTGKTTYAEKARQTLAAFAKVIRETPSAFPEMLVGLDAHLHPMRETVIIGGRDEEDTRRALRLIRSAYLPNHVLVLYDPSEASPILAETPLVQGRQALEGKPTFYVCENFACQAPTTSVDALADRLGIETRP